MKHWKQYNAINHLPTANWCMIYSIHNITSVLAFMSSTVCRAILAGVLEAQLIGALPMQSPQTCWRCFEKHCLLCPSDPFGNQPLKFVWNLFEMYWNVWNSKFGKAPFISYPFIKGWFCEQELSTCGSQSQLISASKTLQRDHARHPKTVLLSAKKCCSRQSAWRFVLALPKLSLQKGRSLISVVLVLKVPNTVIVEAMVPLCETVFFKWVCHAFLFRVSLQTVVIEPTRASRKNP